MPCPLISVPDVSLALESVEHKFKQTQTSIMLRILTLPYPPYFLLFEGGLLFDAVKLIIISNNLN